jgi:hypothetical protein
MYFSSRIKYSERSDAHSEILTMSRELLEWCLLTAVAGM